MSNFRLVIIVIALALSTIAVTTAPPEFSATMVADKPIAANKKNVVAKFFIKGDMVREELLMAKTPSVVISRPDKKVCWVISPDSKTYQEIKDKPAEIPFFWTLETLKKTRGVKLVGAGKHGAYSCDKYRRTIGGKGKSFTATMWFARKLNTVVRLEINPPSKNGASVMKMINIREQAQADSLFELPKGYKKVDAHGRV